MFLAFKIKIQNLQNLKKYYSKSNKRNFLYNQLRFNNIKDIKVNNQQSASCSLQIQMIQEAPKVYSLQVSGIKCTNCAQKITDGLNQVINKNNSKISINILQQKISFTTNSENQKDLDKVKCKLNQLGYPCIKQPYLLSGGNESHRSISFVVPINSKTEKLEQFLKKLMGIIRLQRIHQYSNLRFNVIYDCQIIKGRQIADYIEAQSQFKVINQRVQSFQSQPKLKNSEHSLWLTVFLCFYFLIANMILPFTGDWYMDFATYPKSMTIYTPFVIVNTFLAIYVFEKYAKNIVIRAYNNYASFSSTDMQTLIALGTLSALALWLFFLIQYSFQILSGQSQVKIGTAIMDINDALTSSAIIVLVVTIGRHLQHQVKQKIQKMTQQIFPQSTLFQNMNIKYIQLKNRNLIIKERRQYDVSLLQKNDIIQIQEGRLLLDVIILNGKVKASQSATTGCQDIIQLSKGDRIQSGAIIHQLVTQQCLALVQNVFEKGILIQIGTQVKLAHNQQEVNATGIQAVCKSIASIFVKFVILLSLSTMLIWTILIEYQFVTVPKCAICWIMERGIGVLVASCPCALGLAVPSVIAIVLNIATKSGILIKNNGVFQKMKTCKIISFDKTGTLFTKIDQIQEYHIFTDRFQQNKLWEIIALVQKQLRHPLAEILYKQSFRKSNVTGTNFNFILMNKPKVQKEGISAQLNCKNTNEQLKVLIGNKKILENNFISNQKTYKKKTEAATELFLSINSQVCLAILINTHSNLRPEALEVIAKIQKQGQSVHILSGDSKQSVIKLADYLNIPLTNLHPQHSSNMKTDWIKKIQIQGKQGVMMIGDGLNDIPCLQEASIGVSINAKSQLNINAADIVILSENLHKILALIRLLNKGNLFININLFWAFAYNLIMMPIVAGVFYKYDLYVSPIWSSIAMSMSSVIVVSISHLLSYFHYDDSLISMNLNSQLSESTLYTSQKKGMMLGQVSASNKQRKKQYLQLVESK